MPAMFLTWLRHDRQRYGFTVGQVAWRLGVTRAEYVAIEAGTRWPSSSVWERMRELYGWP